MDNSIVVTDWCEITQVGLRVIREPTWDEFELEIWKWTAAHRLSAWAIADLLNYAERKWGETYAQAMDETGLSYGYLANIRSVASRISRKRRNPNLSFSHHAVVAYLPPDKQDTLLDYAEESRLSRDELRDLVKKNGLPSSIKKDGVEIIHEPVLPLDKLVAKYILAVTNNDTEEAQELFNKLREKVKKLL